MLDIKEIFKSIPHRYPFLLVDRIIEIHGTEKIVGVKNVSMNEHFFQGHFPDKPVMPALACTITNEVPASLKFARATSAGRMVMRFELVAVMFSDVTVSLSQPVPAAPVQLETSHASFEPAAIVSVLFTVRFPTPLDPGASVPLQATLPARMPVPPSR